MPAHYPVPIQEDIRDLLVDLLGRSVVVDKVGALELDEEEFGAIGAFVTDAGDVGALCVMDGRFAVRAGAALVMVPKTAADEDLRRGDVDTHLEVTSEVLNVMTRLLNAPHTPHLRRGDVYKLPGELPDGVAKLLAAPEYRRDFAVTIEGYGDGRMSILVG